MPRGRPKMIGPHTKSYSAALNRKVNKLASQVRKQAPEVNYTNELVAATNTSTSGTLTNLISYPAQAAGNTTDLTRLGDKIKVKDVELRMYLTSVNILTAIRVVVFIDKRNQSAAVTDVFESGTLVATQNAVNALKVHDYEDRYTFLYDKTFDFGDSDREVKTIVKKFNFKKGLDIEFLAGATTVTKNALKMIVIGTGATPQYMYQSRCHFYP